MEKIERLLQLSQEELSLLPEILSAGASRIVVSRAYYAAFYAVQALLTDIGKEPSRMKHREILKVFKESFEVNRPDLLKIYTDLSSERRKADREGLAKGKNEILRIIEDANKFVSEIKILIPNR